MRKIAALHRLRMLRKMRGFACDTWEIIVWILLALPFIGLLWLPFYNHEGPALFGFPFFYWYQLLWVPITALLIWIVYQRGKKNGVE